MKILEKGKPLSLLALAAIFFLSASLSSCSNNKKSEGSEDAATEEVMDAEESSEHPADDAEHPAEEMDEHPADSSAGEEHPASSEGGEEHPSDDDGGDEHPSN